MTRPLPIFKTGNSTAHNILGGWSLDGVFTYRSGTDFSISTRTDQYSQGGAAADPDFYFQPTTSSGTAEFTPPPAGTINAQRVRNGSTGPARGIPTRRFSRNSM
jgi:hypothetical protein